MKSRKGKARLLLSAKRVSRFTLRASQACSDCGPSLLADHIMTVSAETIAKAAHLLVSDVTLTLQECGLLRHRQKRGLLDETTEEGGEKEETFIVISKETVDEVRGHLAWSWCACSGLRLTISELLSELLL